MVALITDHVSHERVRGFVFLGGQLNDRSRVLLPEVSKTSPLKKMLDFTYQK
jgi:hypothetical protein